MRLERREKALENRNGHRRRRQPASPSIIKRLLSHEHDAKACFMPLTCLRWMARTFAASGLMTGYGRAGRRCLRPLVIRCGSIDARQRGVPTRRPIRTDPMRRCMTMARSRAEPRVFAPTGCPISLEGSKNSAPDEKSLRCYDSACESAAKAVPDGSINGPTGCEFQARGGRSSLPAFRLPAGYRGGVAPRPQSRSSMERFSTPLI